MSLYGEGLMTEGNVFRIKRFSMHDGPGIRTTVFLKGCPLSCAWCHNPEGISSRPVLALYPSRCIGCGECSCEFGAIGPGPMDIYRSNCTACGTCVAACPAGAREIMGKTMSAEELLAELLRDRPFFEESGGGVTFSGGEPLLQDEFLLKMLELCRSEGIHTAVDTSCHAPLHVLNKVSQLADLLLCDLKFPAGERMLSYTGTSGELIQNNIRALAEAGVEIVLRMPLIPGLNDDWEALDGISRFILSLPGPPESLVILPYHDAWRDKARRIGIREPFKPGSLSLDIQMIQMQFEEKGIEVKREV